MIVGCISRKGLHAFLIRFVIVLALVIGTSTAATGQQIRYAISGLNEPLLTNVRDSVEGFRLPGRAHLSTRQFDDLILEAEERAREAIKPYGYYQPEIVSELVRVGDERWRLTMRIKRGPPVRVVNAEISVVGDGAAHGELVEWQADWPLGRGKILNQITWQQQKNAVLELAQAQGFLLARFTQNVIEVDLIRNEASLVLALDTGVRAVFGNVEFHQEIVNPAILENIPRFDGGDPYSSELMGKLRLDLWGTGYFTDIDVKEERHLDRTPPTVDVIASLETETKNTYQGAIGFGTDTGLRSQAVYHRRLLTSYGHRLDLGIGYQEFDDELSVRGNYRIPRLVDEREFWVSELTLQTENQDLEFKRDESDESFVKLANGNIDNLFMRLGKLRIRDRNLGYQQIQETVFAQFLRESYDYDPGPDAAPEIRDLSTDPELAHLFRDRVRTLALGIEWDWPAIRGNAFETEGHHERAWIFTSSDAWGSDRDFTQVYLSTRRSYLKGERFKFLLRAEAGYSDADVDSLVVNVDGEPLPLSITELPNQYRFKAGGSNSVRGYGFEDLNDNDVGSNHIITASAEIEMKVLPKWSVAAFVDIGNAFNEWQEPSLKRGIGVGVRWYSIVGAIRLDAAQALDFEGRPWRIHFTMGSPLL
jgi:translocation and assembly module TamA